MLDYAMKVVDRERVFVVMEQPVTVKAVVVIDLRVVFLLQTTVLALLFEQHPFLSCLHQHPSLFFDFNRRMN
jgi:hypothetical protein